MAQASFQEDNTLSIYLIIYTTGTSQLSNFQKQEKLYKRQKIFYEMAEIEENRCFTDEGRGK